MLITEMWKERMLGVIKSIYGDMIDSRQIETLLNTYIQRAQQPMLSYRNIYTRQFFEEPLNTLLDTIKEKDLCVSANNTLTYSYETLKTPIVKMLIESKANRDFHKGKAKEIKTEMTKYKEVHPDEDMSTNPMNFEYLLEDSLNLRIKQFMNSVYGVQGQSGSIINAPDTAGAVTSQGRQLISEMTWSIERALYNTLHFSTENEFYCYLYAVKSEARETELFQYITYFPTDDEVRKTIISAYHRIYGKQNEQIIPSTLYFFIENLTQLEKIYFYYKSNLQRLLFKNEKVYQIIESILLSDVKYLTSGKATPKELMPMVTKLCDIIDEFVIVKISTPKRVFKYTNKLRRAIVVSDTDSIMINLHPYVKPILEHHLSKYNLVYSDDLRFKIINILGSVCVKVTQVAGAIFCERANVPQSLRVWVEMKNEFFFARMIMYMGSKKNYVSYTRLQEGKYRNEIAATGIKLNSSTINPIVNEKILDILENDVLKAQEINPVTILVHVKELERFIIEKIISGDLSFGKKARFSGNNGYKVTKPGIPGVYTNNAGRSAYLWNLIYPDNMIENGDYMYIFDTKLYTEKDLIPLKVSNPAMYQLLIDRVFQNKAEEHLLRYGLRSIGIPSNSKTIPQWLIPFIDYENISNKHLQPIISILASIGNLNISKLKSNKNTYSPIISY